MTRLARIALDAGAHGITVHPRPDRRHIRPDDVRELRDLLKDRPKCEFNIEGNPFEGDWLELVMSVRPDQATLVPDSVDQPTSDHGFLMPDDVDKLSSTVEQLQSAGIRVSVFMDPDAEQIRHVAKTGADRIELYTESFAISHAAGDFEALSKQFAGAAAAAREVGLGVNAGHDLNLSNLHDFVERVEVDEVSIGHALTNDALEFGMRETVRRYNEALNGVVGRAMWEEVSAQRAAVTEEPAGYTNDVRRQSR